MLDVRAEVAELLQTFGISTVLSDDKLSDFETVHHVDSIERCLVNLDSCDEVIFICDQRYGPNLDKTGYDDISATHLEYRRAMANNQPIHFFARDRLITDFSIWNRNKKSNIETQILYAWIKDKHDQKLFNFLDEHRQLVAASKKDNWYHLFSTSIDLKEYLIVYFERAIGPKRLIDAIYENRFPMFDMRVNTKSEAINGVNNIVIEIDAKNIGTVAAFNYETFWPEQLHQSNSANKIMAPQQSTSLLMFLIYNPSVNFYRRKLTVKFDSPLCLSVIDKYDIEISVNIFSDKWLTGGAATFKSREYTRSKNISLTIKEV